MRLSALAGFLFIGATAGMPLASFAGSHTIADFPLRVHIYQANARTHYSSRMVDFVDGEGRANLFEQGDPRGFDFSYRCGDRVMYSAGFETYPARWKKPGAVLEMLSPAMGKANAYEACELKVVMKPGLVYHKHDGLLTEESAARYKDWMLRVQYDPEHGKNEPLPEPKQTEVK